MERILFITPTLTSGGAERRLTNLAIMFRKQGYNVTVLAYDTDYFFEPLLVKSDVKVVKFLGNYLKRLFAVPLIIIKGGYNVSVSLLPTPNFLNCLASFIHKGKRVVITGESSCDERQFSTFKGRVYAQFRHFSDMIICNSERAKDMWLRHYPKYYRKLSVIYNPVVLEFDANLEYKPRNNCRLNILIASSVYSTKNPLGLLDALLLMSDDERNLFHIEWYGSSSTTNNNGGDYIIAQKIIKEHNLESVISFHGPVHDIQTKMLQSDVVALFSKMEGLPNAVCEGMMMHKPIIMTRVSDYDVLVNETNGILCDWDNPYSIKDAILRMARKDGKELMQLGESSAQIAQTLFEPMNVCNQWLSKINESKIHHTS